MVSASLELRALILAPTQRDADVALRLFEGVNILAIACSSETVLLQEIEAGAGVVILTDDLSRQASPSRELRWVMEAQPQWSELPIIALARSDSSTGRLNALRSLPGLVLLERPVQTRTLVSAVQAGLRARERQYQIRGQLEQIRAANAELKAAARAKDEFLATLSHELRNPLSALTAALRVLERASDNPVMASTAREIVGRQTEQMTRLLDDLLDVARITRGRLEIRKTQADVAEIVTAAVETAHPFIQSRGHALNVALPNETIRFQADPARLAQVIGNLLTNAAKYTERGGVISVAARRESDHAVIVVRDNGIGIPAESIAAIFGMFSQLRPAIERSDGGLGIGLALAKGLVELHGGRIDARSEGAGLGSEFIVRIPVGETTFDQAKPISPPHDLRQAKRHIVVADDNSDGLESLVGILEMDGHMVRMAHDGLEAMELVRQRLPEVMVLDIGMPRMNGYEVARRVREHSGGAAVTLIALTGWGQLSDKQLAEQAGFDHHLTKPVDIQALQALVSGLQPTS